jgi:hypothetical protein
MMETTAYWGDGRVVELGGVSQTGETDEINRTHDAAVEQAKRVVPIYERLAAGGYAEPELTLALWRLLNAHDARQHCLDCGERADAHWANFDAVMRGQACEGRFA